MADDDDDATPDAAFDPDRLRIAAAQDFENYKTIERWANEYARGSCTPPSTGSWPPIPFPPPPIASAYLTGQMIEVSLAHAADSQLTGQMIEVSTQEAADASVVGQMFEFSTQQPADAQIFGQMIEVAVKV